jgi:hypothetical protein
VLFVFRLLQASIAGGVAELSKALAPGPGRRGKARRGPLLQRRRRPAGRAGQVVEQTADHARSVGRALPNRMRRNVDG